MINAIKIFRSKHWKKIRPQPALTCSKLTMETVEQAKRHFGRSSVFLVNFEHISQLLLLFIS